MEKIIWNDSFSVGVQELDTQHQVLIGLINQLIESQGAPVQSETISDILSRMLEYTEFHFDAEEKYMAEYGYPEYEAHRVQHLQFIRKTAQLAMDTITQKKSVPQDLLVYLRDWLTGHILNSDMQYKSFFNQHGLS